MLWDILATIICFSILGLITSLLIKQGDDPAERQFVSPDELAALPADLKEKLKDRIPVRRCDLRVAQFEYNQDKLKSAHSEAIFGSGNRPNS